MGKKAPVPEISGVVFEFIHPMVVTFLQRLGQQLFEMDKKDYLELKTTERENQLVSIRKLWMGTV